jgi:hypothetical protein
VLDAIRIVGTAVEAALVAVLLISALGDDIGVGWEVLERFAAGKLVPGVEVLVGPADGILRTDFLDDPEVIGAQLDASWSYSWRIQTALISRAIAGRWRRAGAGCSPVAAVGAPLDTVFVHGTWFFVDPNAVGARLDTGRIIQAALRPGYIASSVIRARDWEVETCRVAAAETTVVQANLVVTTGLAGTPMLTKSAVLDRVVVAAVRIGFASLLVTGGVGGKAQAAVDVFAVEGTLLRLSTSRWSIPIPMIGADLKSVILAAVLIGDGTLLL